MGTAAVQIARALGAIVVGTAGTKDGMDVVTRFSIFKIELISSLFVIKVSGGWLILTFRLFWAHFTV